MRASTLIVAALVLASFGMTGWGCKKKEPNYNLAHRHSPEGVYEKINEVRLQLSLAFEKGELQYIHDNMYYFKDLLTVLSSKLEGDKKQRVDVILKDLTLIADAIDNSAGRKNQAATEANLKQLIEALKDLETEMKPGK